MLRISFSIFLCFVLIFAKPAYSESRIKIGVSLPLSGGAANEGKDLQQLLTFANDKIANGAYDLIFEDDQCNNKDAVNIAQKLVSVDKVSYVLGYACSGAILAAAPIYEKAKIVTFGLATGAPEISKAGDYIFRTIPSLEVAGKRLAEHANKRFKKIAILSEETAYCQGLADAFERHNTKGMLAVERLSYLPGTTDFRSTLAKVLAHGNEAVFLNPQDEQGMIILYRQLLETGKKIPVYAAYYPGFADFKKAFGNQADGIVYADLPFVESSLNAKSTLLLKEYTEKYGRPQSSEFYFVTALAAFDALHTGITNGKDVHSFLYMHHFSGLFGEYSFNEDGDVIGDKLTFILKTLQLGNPILENN